MTAGIVRRAVRSARPVATLLVLVTACAAPPAPDGSVSLRLLRCEAGRDVACLSARRNPATTTTGRAELRRTDSAVERPVWGASLMVTAHLARSARPVSVAWSRAGQSPITLAATWRPPLLTSPAFAGVVDSGAMTPAVRSALATGEDPRAVHSLLLALVLLAGVLLVILVPRLLWNTPPDSDEALAQQLVATRALLSAQELEALRGLPPRDAQPRAPDDPTRHAFRAPGDGR